MPPDARDEPDPSVALAAALDEIGDRWTLLVVGALLDGPMRFGDLQAALGGIAPNVLSQRLRRMQETGLVTAEEYTRRPPRAVYELSDAGRELAGVLRLLTAWMERRRGGAPALRHEVCDTPLEVRWWCPGCERAVDEPGEDLLHL